MYMGKKIAVVMPAYNAARTLERTVREIPAIVDEIILCDDGSVDDTVRIARKLGIPHVLLHPQNRGYGANQKTLYAKALELHADIVVMLHPDYQYTPKLIVPMVHMVATGLYPVVLGSRILGGGALKGGMPMYKYVANRLLTLVQNMLMGQKLSEYHTGYRCFDAEVLRSIDFERNSDGFVFDNELLAQVCYAGYAIGEVSCPTRYFKEASSIDFWRSVRYGMGVLRVSVLYFLTRLGLIKATFLAGRVRRTQLG